MIAVIAWVAGIFAGWTIVAGLLGIAIGKFLARADSLVHLEDAPALERLP